MGMTNFTWSIAPPGTPSAHEAEKIRYWLISRPLRADKVQHVLHASLFVHHVKTCAFGLLFVDRIHVFAKRCNTLHRHI